MIYQIITYEDRYLIIGDADPFFQDAMNKAQWYRVAESLSDLAAVESDKTVLEDIEGNKHELEHNWMPSDTTKWNYKTSYEPKLTQVLVHTDIVGDFKLDAYYVSDHSYLVEVTNIPSGTILAKSFVAFYEPRFGVDMVDMDNILAAAEEMCAAYESSEFQKFLKAE